MMNKKKKNGGKKNLLQDIFSIFTLFVIIYFLNIFKFSGNLEPRFIFIHLSLNLIISIIIYFTFLINNENINKGIQVIGLFLILFGYIQSYFSSGDFSRLITALETPPTIIAKRTN